MEYWSSSFIDGASSSNFISPFYNLDRFPGNQDNRCISSGTMVGAQQGMLHVPLQMVESGYGEESNNNNGQQKKKKKMTSEQLKFLERSFQEDIKLNPDRKMKLSKELGLQPRQIAVWFQNRKARWKNKQLEHLYESLRQEFDVVSREKELLQEELIQLKSMIRENGSNKKMQNWGKACS
ncbi:PREDICTED: homeobox-leucine zipper protein ATHB-22-like [Camelina sativa]|uniref:Homeobox-leucine zipper protein n=1 Tax=Camelina sativa TaxID=90675 RepID=A0ABM0ZK53_CAMSA|nr:PREDICTED: homeobox-leucine zipper protein ATHB-22-like [Camelina sativa]